MFEGYGEVDGPLDWEPGVVDPAEWIPIPAELLNSLDEIDWEDLADSPALPSAGRDDWVFASEQFPVDDHTLAVLNAIPAEQLSVQARSVKLRQLELFSRYVDAQRLELVAVIAGPRPSSPQARLDDLSAQEIAVASLCSVYAADHQVWLARDLAGRLARTAEAMRRGEISLAQARALSEATSQLDVEIARQVEDKVLRFSHRQDMNLFRAGLRRWVAKLDPDFSAKAKEARKEVEVSHTAFGDGTG